MSGRASASASRPARATTKAPSQESWPSPSSSILRVTKRTDTSVAASTVAPRGPGERRTRCLRRRPRRPGQGRRRRHRVLPLRAPPDRPEGTRSRSLAGERGTWGKPQPSHPVAEGRARNAQRRSGTTAAVAVPEIPEGAIGGRPRHGREAPVAEATTGSDLRCNPHVHEIFLDGVYAPDRKGARSARGGQGQVWSRSPRRGDGKGFMFHPVPAPTQEDVEAIVEPLWGLGPARPTPTPRGFAAPVASPQAASHRLFWRTSL